MATLSPEIVAKVRTVTASSYTEQAIFYLNAFWAQGASEEAETVWELVHAFAKEDHVKGKEGNELNPIQAFNVLQKRNQTLTALELKAQLRKVDIDANGEMALCEYLLFINNRDPVAFVTNPQGQVDPVKLKALEDKMVELDNELQILNVKQAEAEKAEKEAKEAQAAADDSAAKAKAAEDQVRAVEEEARVVAAEIKAQEDAKAALIAKLEATSTDQTVGIVKRNMAVQELAQAKNEDPLPLRKAKLTQDAVVRKLEKVTAAAKLVTDEANAKAAVAKDAADQASAAVAAVQAQIKTVQDAVAEIQQEIVLLKSQGDSPRGLLWWKERVLEDKKRSMPTRMW